MEETGWSPPASASLFSREDEQEGELGVAKQRERGGG